MSKVIKSILLVGIDLVGLANSGKNAGFTIFSVDFFGDLDLKKSSYRNLSIINQKLGESTGRIDKKFDPESFVDLTRLLLKSEKIDAILLSSGLDDCTDVLFELNDLIEIVGNRPETIEKTRKKDSFFVELDRLKIPHPFTKFVYNFNEAKKAMKDVGFPLVIKPDEGFAGFSIRKVNEEDEFERSFLEVSEKSRKGVVIQEYIRGTDSSISFMASQKGSKIISFNEQLLGIQDVYQKETFGYCGNTVPLRIEKSTERKCDEIVERITEHFNLRGSNGLDFILTEKGLPYVIELNPRFQGTIECIERINQVNLVKTHIEACLNGFLPKKMIKPTDFCTRLIINAPKRMIAPDLTRLKEVRDIPLPGSIIERGEPLCSIISEGESRLTSQNKTLKIAKLIYEKTRQT
jgi:predicted ATP-grasp superfamily ATP-dependent carboligase